MNNCKIIIILLCGCLLVSLWFNFKPNSVPVQIDLQHEINKAMLQQRVKITDSLISVYESKPPVIVEIETIKEKYEKITDSIIGLPIDDRIRFISNYLDAYGK